MHSKYLFLFVLPTITAILTLLSSVPHVSGSSPIIYVDADAAAAPDGLSWTTAYTNVQSALDVAVGGYDIWVAEGIYYPDEGSGQTNDDITSTFVLTDGVALYGGFDPGSGVDEMAERDWETYVTILSGDIDQNDETDPSGVVVTATQIVGNNAYHVVSSENVTRTALIDGFYITAGQATGTPPHNRGGGMYNSQHSLPTISNVTFIGNSATAGGGMFNWNHSDPTLKNVTFSNNMATDGGGMSGNGNPSLTDVTFAGNTAYRGGGMQISDGEPTLTHVTFSANSATVAGGGMHTSGSQFTLTSGIFSGNSSQNGGGMYNKASDFALANVTFSDNSAFFDGGAIQNYDCDPTLTNVDFIGNSAGGVGGGMDSHYYSEPSLTNVTFSGNWAGQHGGGMYNRSGGVSTYYGNTVLTNVVFAGNLSSFSGGGLSNDHNNPTMTNVTFSGNLADYGGGLSNWHNSSPTIINTIFWGNTASYGNQIYNYDISAPVISYSDIQNSVDSGSWDSALGADSGHNIDDNPLFVRNPDPGSDGNWDGADDDFGDLHLQGNSPAIDSGSNANCPATDLDQVLRPFNGLCDIGAYEYIPDALLAINYASGAPGSVFTLTGSLFPTNDSAAISVNGTALGMIPTDGSGDFSFLLSTTNADVGTYYVMASVNPSATVQFTLSSDEPTRPQEGIGTVLDIPGGIAYAESIMLPIVRLE